MAEFYVQVPEDSSGKKCRTWTGSGLTHSEAVVLTLADADNTFIDPRMIRITGSDETLAITGSVTISPVVSGSGIYTQLSAVMITGSINLNSGSPLSGSINNWPALYVVSPNISGSGIYTQLSAVMVTGSINLNSSSAITGSINNWPTMYATSGSGVYTYASAQMVTGSININSSSAITGSINNWPTSYASSQSGNWYTGLSGSWKDTVTTGGTFATITANSGASVIALSGTTKIKLFDVGFAPQSAGCHYFYFGTTTGSIQSRMILTCSGAGTFHQSYPFQRTSNAGDALYVYSTTAETGLCFDLSYIQE